MQNFMTLGQPPLGEKYVSRKKERKKERKRAHALCLDQKQFLNLPSNPFLLVSSCRVCSILTGVTLPKRWPNWAQPGLWLLIGLELDEVLLVVVGGRGVVITMVPASNVVLFDCWVGIVKESDWMLILRSVFGGGGCSFLHEDWADPVDRCSRTWNYVKV